ncbi:MAG: hypothetical protein COV46_01235 [Deltaproteobacteria bacterium CG11_big_fil_rev_8_21_14_0_20_49_13]|nr:MAG: hypothetical protein COV46_01235 [Deltaproteobacteria bacterium CG11_big_fil_rev_8_21_14_0_20_49_13]
MKNLLGYILISAGLIICVPAFKMVSGLEGFSPIPFLLSHLLSASLFGLGFYYLTPVPSGVTKRGNLWMTYVFFLCLLLPVYGIFSSLLIFIMQKNIRGKRPPSVVEDVITVQDPSIFSKASTRSKHIEILQKLDIEPFIDIFIKGQSDKKKSAIKLLQRARSKKTIGALLIALNDEDLEVRLFAAGVVGSIEDEYNSTMKELQLKYRSGPGNRQAALELVDFYIRYAESGLPDQIIREHYYNEAHAILQGLPREPKTLYLQTKTDIALERYDEALRSINECLKIDGTNGNYRELYMEILFEKRDYKALVAGIVNAKEQKVNGISNETMAYWS